MDCTELKMSAAKYVNSIHIEIFQQLQSDQTDQDRLSHRYPNPQHVL